MQHKQCELALKNVYCVQKEKGRNFVLVVMSHG